MPKQQDQFVTFRCSSELWRLFRRKASEADRSAAGELRLLIRRHVEGSAAVDLAHLSREREARIGLKR